MVSLGTSDAQTYRCAALTVRIVMILSSYPLVPSTHFYIQPHKRAAIAQTRCKRLHANHATHLQRSFSTITCPPTSLDMTPAQPIASRQSCTATLVTHHHVNTASLSRLPLAPFGKYLNPPTARSFLNFPFFLPGSVSSSSGAGYTTSMRGH
jgi:hypothetical protein